MLKGWCSVPGITGRWQPLPFSSPPDSKVSSFSLRAPDMAFCLTTGTKGTRPGDHGLKARAKINVFLINCSCQVSVAVTKAGNKLTQNAGSHEQVQIGMKTKNKVRWSAFCQDDKTPEENNLGRKSSFGAHDFTAFSPQLVNFPALSPR